MLSEMLLESWNVGRRLRPFSTGSWAAWLRQFLPHFLALYRKFLLPTIFAYDHAPEKDVIKIRSHDKYGYFGDIQY